MNTNLQLPDTKMDVSKTHSLLALFNLLTIRAKIFIQDRNNVMIMLFKNIR